MSVKFLRSFLVFFLGLFALSAQGAYFQADFPTQATSMDTHVIITGKGLEVSDQWLRAAHTQALVFHDRPAHGKIRWIGAIEDEQTLVRLKKWGYQNIQVFDTPFTGARLLERLQKINSIASMDWIGHNGAVVGFVLEDYSNRFYLDHAKELARISAKMTKNSFVRIMGCNTGWNLAPAVAKALRVPVSGTFTFADIQKLHETQEWFYNDAGRFPGGNFLKRNEISFNRPVDCIADGGCLRLKPVHISYQGRHGNYAGTVPFMKYFCADLDPNECGRRMVGSLQFEISEVAVGASLTENEFRKILADRFCPGFKDMTKRQACRDQIEAHLSGAQNLPANFTTSSGATLSCSMKKCAIKMDCSGGSCVMIGEGSSGDSTTFVDELNFYLRAFQGGAR